MKTSIAALGITLALSVAAAPTADIVIGAGAQPCSTWSQGRSAGPDDPQRVVEALILSWVQGHMTGINTAQSNMGHPLQAMPDTDYLRTQLDDYCKAHPQDTVWKAALAIHAMWVARSLGWDDQ